MEKLNQYHRQAIAKKMKSIAYWRKHPMSREECLNQFKQLREQRSLRESRFQTSKDSQETGGYWIEDINTIGIFSDRGSENEVYLSIENNTTVYKLNDFRYSDDNLSQFFERIRIHNIYFPDCSYKLIGFAYNKAEKVCAVLSQPFIVAMREATEPEIEEELNKMGFSSELDGEFFSNGNYDIFDALPNNVLVGNDGHLYFIDTIIYKSQDNGFEKYKSLSPRYNQ